MNIYGGVKTHIHSFQIPAKDGDNGYILWLAALGPRKDSELHITQQAVWTAELVWAVCKRENLLPLSGNKPRFFGRLVRSRDSVPVNTINRNS